MAARKLDIDAPLLSVRRFSMKSTSSSLDEDEKVFGNYRRHNVLDQVTEPVAVPFLWEQIPGRRKDGNDPASELVQKATVTPRLPPGRVLDAVGRHSGFKALPLTEDITKLKSFEEGMNEKEGGDDEEEDDDAFLVAIGMMAMPETFSMTCSVSGLSNADVKASGTFSTDAETRDFIMSRFLPAARAMTLQLTRDDSKKQPTAPQEPSQDNMVVSVRRHQSIIKYGALSVPHYRQDKEVKSEVQCRDEKHNDTGTISAKGCGLFARVCLKSHLRLLNPVPGMKIRARALMPSKSKIERPVEAALIHTHSQIIKKALTSIQNVPCKHKSGELPTLTQKDGFYNRNLAELPKLTQDMTGGSKRVSYSGNLQTMGRLSPTKCSGEASMMSMDEGSNQEMELLEFTKKSNEAYQYPKVEGSATVKVGRVESPLPPPLPKPPSESWLWRTLPTVNAQNSHSRTQLPGRKQDVLKHSPPITNWETIVKTSNPRHDHSRYSQELLVHPYNT